MTLINRLTNDPKKNGLILLAISCCFGLVTLYWGTPFGDEIDNLVVGSLVSQKYVLYRDAFSHHFPFAYYWVAILFTFFRNTIFVARLSMFLFQVAALVISMQLTNYWLALGVTSLLWSVVRLFYRGHMLLYDGFCAASLLVIFTVTLAILRDGKINGTHRLAITVFSAIAILSNPLSVYPICIAIAFIFSKDIRSGLLIVAGTGILLSLYAAYLFLSGTLDDFVNSAILFNSHIYAKYKNADANRVLSFLSFVINGLGITNGQWFHFDPLKPIDIVKDAELDQWIFTGFLFRFGILLASLNLVLNKKFRPAGFVYLWFAAMMVFTEPGWRGQTFVMLALVCLSLFAAGQIRLEKTDNMSRIFTNSMRLLVSCMAIWLFFRMSYYVIQHREQLLPEQQYSSYKLEAKQIRELTCGQENVLLVDFPAGFFNYWFTGMKPVSKYTFMWPWVAEVGLRDVIDALKTRNILAIVILHDGTVWGKYDSREYLKPLDNFLDKHYEKIGERTYQSPELYRLCSSQQ